MRLRLSCTSCCVLFLVLFAALFCPRHVRAQRTIHVPADQPTIQAGINAANNGDTVLVAPGMYYENIDFQGKGITVTAAGTAGSLTSAVIDGGTAGATVSFVSGEGASSVLSNLTIMHGGSATSGTQGGIYIHGAGPTIRANQVFGATCYGIHSDAGFPLIESNRIVATNVPQDDTACQNSNGSALLIEGQNADSKFAVVRGNTIEANYSSGTRAAQNNGGGGIAIRSGANVLVEKNILSNNAAGNGGKGGAILIFEAGGVLLNNLIYGNDADADGGGIAIVNSTNSFPVALVNNTITGNVVLSPGPVGSQVSDEGVGPVALNNNIISAMYDDAAVTCNGQGAIVSLKTTMSSMLSGPLFRT